MSTHQVAEAGGSTIHHAIDSGDENVAMQIMAQGAAVLARWKRRCPKKRQSTRRSVTSTKPILLKKVWRLFTTGTRAGSSRPEHSVFLLQISLRDRPDLFEGQGKHSGCQVFGSRSNASNSFNRSSRAFSLSSPNLSRNHAFRRWLSFRLSAINCRPASEIDTSWRRRSVG